MERCSCLLKLRVHYFIVFFVLQTVIFESLASSDCSPIVNTIDRIRCTGPNLKNITRNAKALIVNGIPSNPIRLNKINRSIFTGLNLTEIFISFTDLTDVEEDSFQDLKQLRRIVLRNNQIGQIHKGTFHGLKFLEMIDLSGNQYCSIESGTFSRLSSLRQLYLGNMKLRSLDESTFQGLNSLLMLDLHGNKLQSIPNNVISSFPKLQLLDLKSNNLKTLSKDLKPTLIRIHHLSLSDNPWQCHCDMKWMKALNNLTFFRNRNHYSEMIICYEPTNLQYRPLFDVPSSELICIPPKIIQCGGPYHVMEGSSLAIHCETKGFPFPDFTWLSPSGLSISSNNKKDTSGFVTTDNGTLVISVVTVTSRGTWKVLAKNSRGNDSSGFEVNVQAVTTVSAVEINTGEKKKTDDNSMILIAAGAGGGGFLLIVTITGCCLYHQSKNNKVKPKKRKNGAGKGRKKGK